MPSSLGELASVLTMCPGRRVEWRLRPHAHRTDCGVYEQCLLQWLHAGHSPEQVHVHPRAQCPRRRHQGPILEFLSLVYLFVIQLC